MSGPPETIGRNRKTNEIKINNDLVDGSFALFIIFCVISPI